MRAREAGGSYRPGDVVFETIDGGGLPGRVVATMADAAEVLVRLDPALSPLPGLRTRDREAFRHRGYLVFAASSLSPLLPAAPVQPHAEAEPSRGNGASDMHIAPPVEMGDADTLRLKLYDTRPASPEIERSLLASVRASVRAARGYGVSEAEVQHAVFAAHDVAHHPRERVEPPEPWALPKEIRHFRKEGGESDVTLVSVLITDFGSLPVPAEVEQRLREVAPQPPHWADPDRLEKMQAWNAAMTDPVLAAAYERQRQWERVQCRLAGEAWARGETHTVNTEGLDEPPTSTAVPVTEA